MSSTAHASIHELITISLAGLGLVAQAPRRQRAPQRICSFLQPCQHVQQEDLPKVQSAANACHSPLEAKRLPPGFSVSLSCCEPCRRHSEQRSRNTAPQWPPAVDSGPWRTVFRGQALRAADIHAARMETWIHAPTLHFHGFCGLNASSLRKAASGRAPRHMPSLSPLPTSRRFLPSWPRSGKPSCARPPSIHREMSRTTGRKE